MQRFSHPPNTHLFQMNLNKSVREKVVVIKAVLCNLGAVFIFSQSSFINELILLILGDKEQVCDP